MTKACALLLVLASTGCLMLPPPSSAAPGSSSSSSSTDPDATSTSDHGPAPTSFSSVETTPASASRAPAAPTTVSVTLRSSCSKTVKVFYGDKPGFSSGTQSSISSNSVSSKTFRPGDQIWLVDDAGKGVTSVSVGEHTRQVEVTSSCGGLSTR